MRFATLRNYPAFLRSHGIRRCDDNTREVLWWPVESLEQRRARNVCKREQDRRERERGGGRAFVARERKSLRNRCPSGQKAFIVLFRSYGRRHKRGRPNSYGCRFCNVRVRSPIEKTDDHQPTLLLLLLLHLDRNPMKLLRNTRPVRHFTSLHSLETVETGLKRIRDKKETSGEKKRSTRQGCGVEWKSRKKNVNIWKYNGLKRWDNNSKDGTSRNQRILWTSWKRENLSLVED